MAIPLSALLPASQPVSSIVLEFFAMFVWHLPGVENS
jgi:hypothetical protein